ncbi:T9SS type A sorting domain-containing protein, partial [Flavobacterium tegetincola]|uniref:T9SS type A sorting domain-containing protein n=1 Tax=Flavobacterium tegetincola TaxID=150172 RepID=UPI0012F81C1E
HRAGEYTVTATDANGCVNTASQTISVSPRLTLNTIPVIPPACEGSSFTINSIATITNVNRTNSWPYFALSAGNSNDISYAWSGPNGFTSSSSNASVSNASMNNAGTYSLTVTGPGGCTKSADRNIIINPLPTIELAASAAVCVGSDITLTATSNGTILSWFRNGTFLAFGSSYTISSADMSDAGSYTFRARSNNLCVVEQSIDVTVNAVPTLLEIMIAPVCSGSSATVVLTGLLPTTNGIATYSINGGAPQIESGISDGNGRFSFNTPTLGMGQNNYTVEILSITNIETGCFTNFTGKTAILKVNPNPSLSTIETSPICSGSPATILLSGLLPNTNGTATYTINGGITQFQASGVSSSQGTFSFQTDPLPAAANGFTINIIKIRNVDTSCETSFTNKTVTLIVNASPTLAAITIAPIVKNNKATVVLSGLLKNQLGTATYTVNGGSEQQASGTSTSAGTFSFQTPTLGVAQNGWIVRIISIKNNDNLCETAFSNMQAPLAVTNSLRSENTPTVSNNEVIAPTFGLQNQAKIDIVLYPNPASDVLNIETALEVQSVIMLNINGQIVLSSNQKQVNVSALPAGIYMVQIKDAADNVTTKKIIIK